MQRAIKAAFPQTLPVMIGYIFVGIAYGLLLQKTGYGVLWAIITSFIVYSGALQFILISFFTGGLSLIQVAIVSLTLSSRHMFYGLSLFDKFKGMGKKKLYMIFSLTDETYSLLCATKAPDGVDEKKFYFSIAFLNQCYWITGSVIGATIGELITFNTTGIDFAMTALFVVIFVEQWMAAKSYLPAIIGIVCAVVSIAIFGPANFILPSLILTVLCLLSFRTNIERKEGISSCL